MVSRRESEEVVSQLLEENAGLVRRLVAANSNLGQIPRLVFVLDNQYLFEVTMDKLYDKMELGPRDDSEEENAAGWEKVESLVLKNDVGGLRRGEIMDAVHAEMEKKKALHRSQYTEEQFEEAYRETVENNRCVRTGRLLCVLPRFSAETRGPTEERWRIISKLFSNLIEKLKAHKIKRIMNDNILCNNKIKMCVDKKR